VLVTHQLSAVSGFATDVALVDRDRQLFEVGPAREMITEERLGRLYGRAVRVADVGGHTAVVVGDPPVRNGDAAPKREGAP
jgi:ABC-type cobalamin/Fe3+-siderophores transport system ATPase subunit